MCCRCLHVLLYDSCCLHVLLLLACIAAAFMRCCCLHVLLLLAPALACIVPRDSCSCSCSCSLAALATFNRVLQVNVSARAQWDRRDDSWIESDVTCSKTMMMMMMMIKMMMMNKFRSLFRAAHNTHHTSSVALSSHISRKTKHAATHLKCMQRVHGPLQRRVCTSEWLR